MLIASLLFAAARPPILFSHPDPESLGPSKHYSGEMVRQGQALPISVDLSEAVGARDHTRKRRKLDGRFTCMSQQVMDYPLDSVDSAGGKLDFVLGGGIDFHGILEPGRIEGGFTGPDGSGAFTLRPTQPEPLPYRLEEVTIKSGDVVLAGSLAMPKTRGLHAGIVLLHGSGRQTRWGTLRFLADQFARKGIAALIYDKRGSGGSTGQLESFTYNDLAGDALAAVRFLARQPQVDPKRIGLLGHSEGGLTAAIAAATAPKSISFLVAEDCVAGPLYEQDLYRVHNALQSSGFGPEEIKLAESSFHDFVDVARGAKPKDVLEADRQKYGDAGWFQWLAIPPAGARFWETISQRESVDSLTYWRRVRAPVLLIFGENDNLLPVDLSIRKLEDALKGHASCAPIIVPFAQHNLTVQPGEKEPFFWWHAAPGVTDLVIAWVRAHAD